MPDMDCFDAAGNVSMHNARESRKWPKRRTIWSCQAELGPLFTRYYLFESKPLSVYIHCFHTSDEDRALHDHPWSFLSFLFHRGYWEWTPYTTGWGEGAVVGSKPHWRPRFSILYRPATWAHRVELAAPDTWTLVFRFKRTREWGFWPSGVWQQWQAYGKEWCD